MLTLRDKLRATCHSLRMRPFVSLDPAASKDILSRVSKLPSAERIAALHEDELRPLQVRIDTLLFDIGRAENDRSKRRAIRHMVDTGLPPARPPLLARKTWYDLAKELGP